MSAASNRWKPGLKLAAFRPALHVRVVRASLRSCPDAEHRPRRLLDTPGRRTYWHQGAARLFGPTPPPAFRSKKGPVCSNARHALEQHKFTVADDTDVQAGRPNRTSLAAERNAESLLYAMRRRSPCRAATAAWRGASSGSKVLSRPQRPDAQGIQLVPPPCPKGSGCATE